jgi:hypothetical protein
MPRQGLPICSKRGKLFSCPIGATRRQGFVRLRHSFSVSPQARSQSCMVGNSIALFESSL